MAVLIDHDDVGVVVHRDNGDRTVVLDDLAPGDVTAWHPHIVGAQRENLPLVEGLGAAGREVVFSHGLRIFPWSRPAELAPCHPNARRRWPGAQESPRATARRPC